MSSVSQLETQEHPSAFSTDFDSLAKSFDYIAWVPVAMGRLNFSRVSPALAIDSKKLPRNDRSDLGLFKQYTKNERRVLVSSVFDWKDRKDKAADGVFRIVLMADVVNHNRDNVLKGRIYIYPHEFSGRSGNKEASEFISSFVDKFSHLEALNGNLEHFNLDRIYLEEDESESYDCRKDADELLDSMSSYMENLSKEHDECYCVEFLTKKNGLTFISFESFGKKYDRTSIEVVSRQAFYYLKYSLHTHKHHPHQEDSITTIHSLDISEKSLVAAEMLDELQKCVVDIKVFLHENRASNHQIEGIVSYCKALVDILYRESVIHKDERERRIFVLENYLGSARAISLKYTSDEKLKTGIKKSFSDMTSSFKQGFGILLALVSLLTISYFNIYSKAEVAEDFKSGLINISTDPRGYLIDFYTNVIIVSAIVVFGSLFYGILRFLLSLIESKVRMSALDRRALDRNFSVDSFMRELNFELKVFKCFVCLVGVILILKAADMLFSVLGG